MSQNHRATQRTLLERLNDAGDAEAWQRFHTLYAPLLEEFARGQGLSRDDAEELRDECLATVVAKLPAFQYDPSKGGFKGWLFRLAQGKAIDLLRKPRARRAETGELASLPTADPSPDEAWEDAWRREHLKYALKELAERVSERTYQVFTLLLDGGTSVPEIGERMGMTANQIYKAKARALRVLHDVLERLET